MAEWLESLTSNHLPLTAVGSIPGQTGNKIFHVRKPSSWLTVGRWFYPGARSGMNNARRGTWGLPPPSKLEKSPYDLSCVGVTIKPNQKTKICHCSTCVKLIHVCHMSKSFLFLLNECIIHLCCLGYLLPF